MFQRQGRVREDLVFKLFYFSLSFLLRRFNAGKVVDAFTQLSVFVTKTLELELHVLGLGDLDSLVL